MYLQIHIIRDPAYQVLIGRPFDLLTKSRVETMEDGSQIVTITDPNTGKRCAIPTFDRGKYKRRSSSADQSNVEHVAEVATGGFRSSSRN